MKLRSTVVENGLNPLRFYDLGRTSVEKQGYTPRKQSDDWPVCWLKRGKIKVESSCIKTTHDDIGYTSFIVRKSYELKAYCY